MCLWRNIPFFYYSHSSYKINALLYQVTFSSHAHGFTPPKDIVAYIHVHACVSRWAFDTTDKLPLQPGQDKYNPYYHI